MIIEDMLNLIFQSLQVSPIIAITALFLLVFLAYKVFQVAVRSLIFGALAAAVPIAAFVLGVNIGVPLEFSTILWFVIFGIASYLAYFTVASGLKTIKMVMAPVARLFGEKKEKIIIREIVKEEDDDD